ncbi:hypothetical protein GDO78_007919, partial [Eleutherodactylus coqui]
NGFKKKDDQESMEDEMFYMYGSTAAHIKEETEYVRTIRATLEKIQSQLFRDELYSKNTQEKLEATREAGAGAIRDATRKLYENYNKRSEQLRKSHEEEKHPLQVSAADHEDRLKKSIEKLNDVAEKIQEKHSRIFELEKLMERMEADEVFTVEEQINHLQRLMMSQHQNLRSLIQEIEDLKARLKEQDTTIGELKEKVSFLECQNKELKYKVQHWSDPSKIKVTKFTLVNESMLRKTTPYHMLMKHKNS